MLLTNVLLTNVVTETIPRDPFRGPFPESPGVERILIKGVRCVRVSNQKRGVIHPFHTAARRLLDSAQLGVVHTVVQGSSRV